MAQSASQFEIWLADLNPRFGTEPGKVRPVVVVQTDLLNSVHPSTIICPITTKIRNDVEVLRVHLTKSNSGLQKPSDILIDQIRAIDNRRFVKRIGSLKDKASEMLKKRLKIIMDLE